MKNLMFKFQLIAFVAIVFFININKVEATTFVVTNTNDSGQGSFRQAILDANIDDNLDVITFNIPTNSDPSLPHVPQKITLTTKSLPKITGAVFIDGWSQVGEGVVGIELDAQIYSEDLLNVGWNIKYNEKTIIRGLAFSGKAENCLFINRPNTDVYGNYIGLKIDGKTLANCHGVIIYSSNINIGGDDALHRNIIAGSVYTFASASDSNIIGNYIGLDKDGNVLPYGDVVNGIVLVAGYNINIKNNVLGGTIKNPNAQYIGPWCFSAICVGDLVSAGYYVYSINIEHNFIGVGPDGKSARPNESGITINPDSYNVVINNNVISGNINDGINLFTFSNDNTLNGSVSNAKIVNNIIGLSADGEEIIGQIQSNGIHIDTSDGFTIGKNNIISGNLNGVLIHSSIGVKVDENFIGVGVDKKTPRPNKNYGILVSASSSSIISNNLVAYNGASGIGVSEFSNKISILNNSIYKNFILGIDLIPSGGVTLNDESDIDEGANDLMNFPVIQSAVYNPLLNEITFVVSLDTPKQKLATVQFFSNSSPNPTGYGEGERFLGQVKIYPGLQTIKIPLSFSPLPGSLTNISATATVENKTSEFSKIFSRVSYPK